MPLIHTTHDPLRRVQIRILQLVAQIFQTLVIHYGSTVACLKLIQIQFVATNQFGSLVYYNRFTWRVHDAEFRLLYLR